MNEKQTIVDCATRLKLHYVKVYLEETICQAQIDKPTYMSFLAQVVRKKVNGRMEREQKRRIALAHLPAKHALDYFDFNYSAGINRQEMKELNWLDRAYTIMLFPMDKEDAAGFFNLINTMHERTSIIITTNKAPTEWAQTLDDEVIASVLLDRLLYKCEVISLKGNSY